MSWNQCDLFTVFSVQCVDSSNTANIQLSNAHVQIVNVISHYGNFSSVCIITATTLSYVYGNTDFSTDVILLSHSQKNNCLVMECVFCSH